MLGARSYAVALCVAVATLFDAGAAPAAVTCDDFLPKRDPDSERREFGACKPHPLDPGKLIVATTRYQEGSSFTSPPDPDMGLFDLEVALVSATDGRKLKQQVFKGALSSDAVWLRGIALDTALYTLAPGVRAVGVRAEARNNSRASPYGHETLALYVETARGFRAVLDQLDMKRSSAEWDTDCAGRLEEVTRTIAVLTSATNGYRDLRVTTRLIETDMRKRSGECEHLAKKPQIEHTILRYDGSKYPQMPN